MLGETVKLGYGRRHCTCRQCQHMCRGESFMRPFLIPSDLDRMTARAPDPLAWAEENLHPGTVGVSRKKSAPFDVKVLFVKTADPGGYGRCKLAGIGVQTRCLDHINCPFVCSHINECEHGVASLYGTRLSDACLAVVAEWLEPSSRYVGIYNWLDGISDARHVDRAKGHYETVTSLWSCGPDAVARIEADRGR